MSLIPERESVARLIDKNAWAIVDEYGLEGTHPRVLEPSLTSADAILNLLAYRELVEGLERINRRASPNPERTADVAFRDLEWITAEARRLLSTIQEPRKIEEEHE